MKKMIIRLTMKLTEEEIKKREKELSAKLNKKVVILGPEYGEIIETN